MLRILLQRSAQHDSASRRVLTGDERDIAANLRTIAAERHLKVRIAYDGMKVAL